MSMLETRLTELLGCRYPIVQTAMGWVADPKLVAEVEKIVDGWPGVQGHHDLRSRSAGSQVFINMHIEVDGSLTLFEAHEIGAALKREICTRFPEVDLIIHKDPAQ